MHSNLHIQTASISGKTFLKNTFCNQPFKVANITEGVDNTLRLMIMSSSPGILDGDTYDIKMVLEENSAVEIETQSYQRLFSMKKTASQSMEVYMKSNSSLIYLPHPVVPHKASDFTSKSRIYMSEGCSLLLSEVLTCGRKLNGEAFCFSGYRSVTEIFRDDKLVVKENLLIRPATIDLSSIGQLERFSHQASFICINESMQVKEVIESIRKNMVLQTGMISGITELPVNGFILRMLGNKAEQLFDCIKNIADNLQTIPSNKNVTTPVYAN